MRHERWGRSEIRLPVDGDEFLFDDLKQHTDRWRGSHCLGKASVSVQPSIQQRRAGKIANHCTTNTAKKTYE